MPSADVCCRAQAQECLEKTYGRNMERLKRLKGGAPEMILYVRLNLLRAIAAYHNNGTRRMQPASYLRVEVLTMALFLCTDSAGAQRYLNEAETKLNSLKVTDDELVGLIAMGFSATGTSCVCLSHQCVVWRSPWFQNRVWRCVRATEVRRPR